MIPKSRHSPDIHGNPVVPMQELRDRYPEANDDYLRALQADPTLARFDVTSMEGLGVAQAKDPEGRTRPEDLQQGG